MNQLNHGFDASLFHPDFPEGPVAGRLMVGQAQVRFHSEPVSIDFALSRLEVEFDATGQGIFFNDSNALDIKAFTWDRSILKHPAIRLIPEVAKYLSRTEFNRAARLTLYFAGGCVVAIFLCSLAMKAMAGAIAARVPMSWEKKLGTDEITSLQKSDHLLDDTNEVAKLTALAAPLIQVLPSDRRDLKFFIADDPDPNAFALPGGYVVVNKGLLKMADQPEELLGVLAHELGHQVRRHAIRRGVASAGPLVIFGLFLHSDNGLGNLLAAGSGLMVFQSFSQDYEAEADETGWNFLVAANIDPRGMIHMFEKLLVWEKKFGMDDAGPQALRSHPATAKRIERLEKKWDKLPRKTDFLKLEPVQWSEK